MAVVAGVSGDELPGGAEVVRASSGSAGASTPALRRRTLPREYTTGRYLGYHLEITNYRVHVYAPTGRWVGTSYSMSGARRLVRGYRGAKR